MKNTGLLFLPVVALVILSACIGEEQQPMTQLIVRSHANQVYEFTNDIRESFKVPANDPDHIRGLLGNSTGMFIVFDGSDEKDNAIFSKAIINMLSKIQTYYAYEGKVFNQFPAFYHIGSQWHSSNGTAIDEPFMNGPVLWLKGPNTGATKTAVTVQGNIIYVEGVTNGDFDKAADKFVLIVFGVTNLP